MGEGAKIVLPMALKRVKEKQEELKQVGSKCEELEGENEELRAAVEAEKARVARLEGEMDKVQAELRAARADLDAMEAAPLQASPVGSPLRAASPEAQALDATMAAIEGEMSHISSELGGSSLENRIVPYNSELMRTVEIQHERYRSLQAELQELRDDLVAKEQAALEQVRVILESPPSYYCPQIASEFLRTTFVNCPSTFHLSFSPKSLYSSGKTVLEFRS